MIWYQASSVLKEMFPVLHFQDNMWSKQPEFSLMLSEFFFFKAEEQKLEKSQLSNTEFTAKAYCDFIFLLLVV